MHYELSNTEYDNDNMDEATRARLLLDASMAALHAEDKAQQKRFLAEAEEILINYYKVEE